MTFVSCTKNPKPVEINPNEPSLIKPEKALEILKKNGINVTLEEAKNILEFLIFLANLSIDQLVDQDKKPS